VLNKIFKRINFHGHLRLSRVCKKWHNVVQDDASFMRSVKFAPGRISKKKKLMGSYRNVVLHHFRKNRIDAKNLQKLMKNAEKIDFGPTTPETLNYVVPLCKNLGEMEVDIATDNTALTFVHPLPVKISTTQISSLDVLDRFKKITDISGLVLSDEPSNDFMVKYGGLVTSITVEVPSGRQFHNFGRMENFHLSFLGLIGQFEKHSIRSFFGTQASFLKSIEIKGTIEDFMFESMWMLLKNLESVTISFRTSQNLCLNKLKALTKLECLIIEVKIAPNSIHQSYHLDIAELTKLTALRVSCINGVLRISSLDKPMSAIEKFEIFGHKFDLEALKQIALTMPGLKELRIHVNVRNIFD
jgi:F-box domain